MCSNTRLPSTEMILYYNEYQMLLISARESNAFWLKYITTHLIFKLYVNCLQDIDTYLPRRFV